ncbi:MAG: pyridoxal phosphate-dependent decarboxylase family protein [Myxococcota bacterium]
MTGEVLKDGLPEAFESFRALVGRVLEAEREEPVRAPIPPQVVERMLPLRPPEHPRPWSDVAVDLERLATLGPRTSTQAFFNQLFGGRLGSATVADMLACLLNHSMYTFKVAGPHVLLEKALISHMGRLVGFEETEGTFAPGGSLSNLVAMILARNVHFPGSREEGIDGQRPMVYVSAEGHYSIKKNAGLIGLGRRNVRSVPVDDSGRMDPHALRAAVREDARSGLEPFMVVGTAGTTVRGAFDPIDALADVAEAEGLWLHVDGAYGGSLLLSSNTRHLLAGCHRVDSFTWDAHKLMGVPLTSSVLLLPRSGLLERNLSEAADYLFQGSAESLDPGQRSLQCGRRNDALKLWTAWQRHGDQGFAARIDRCRALARICADGVRDRPRLRLVEEPQSMNVCFEVPGVDVDRLVSKLNDSGQAVVGTASVHGRRVIRWVAVNPEIREEHVHQFLASVESEATAVDAA